MKQLVAANGGRRQQQQQQKWRGDGSEPEDDGGGGGDIESSSSLATTAGEGEQHGTEQLFIPTKGPLSVSVPGAAAGWCYLHDRFGSGNVTFAQVRTGTALPCVTDQSCFGGRCHAFVTETGTM